MEPTVVIKRCQEYDRNAIEKIITDGMTQLDYRPTGNVFVKPNVVFANNPDVFGQHAYTPASFVGASLTALSRREGVKRIDVGENSAIGIPTRLNFKFAGYYDEIKKVRQEAACPVDIFCIDEELRDSVFIGGMVHDNLRIPRKMARADSKVYLPKLKCHCVSNMTGAVKLNIGICSDDERAIRHDFMLNDKITDLLATGYPDFIVMDAVDVGMGNEAVPTARKLGLIIMGTNPVAVDLVAARLLGLGIDDVPYLKKAVNRGYTPTNLEEIKIDGDLTSIEDLDEHAKRIMPYDDEYHRWQDVNKELTRLNSPMRFLWGPYKGGNGSKCLTGCVMGIKMFLGSLEWFAGSEAFADAKPVVFIIGRIDEQVDARGEEVFLIGSCSEADIIRAKKITHLDKCFTTASDMNIFIGHKLGMPAISRDFKSMLPLLIGSAKASMMKLVKLRYFQDIGYFITKRLDRRL